MDRELAALWQGHLAEQRRMADDPRPDPDCDETDETDETACPFGRVRCSPRATLDGGDDGFPCISCWLRTDRDDDGPHPTVAAAADSDTDDEPSDETKTRDRRP